MKAVVRHTYGSPSTLRVEEVAEPSLEPGHVIVKVAAAGVNMAEWHLTTGEPRIARLALGFPRPKRITLGEDVAGVVAAVGPGVTRVRVGDAVFGSARGSWAELVSATEELLQPMPEGVTFEQAAGLPMSGYTALQALRACGPVQGKRIAVTGAGGGVGSALVQLASARGARVTAVCSTAKVGFVRELGAHEVIDYTVADPTAVGQRFDVVLDFAGNLPIRQWKPAIVAGGVLVLGGGEGGGKMLGAVSRSLQAPFTRGIKVVTLMAMPKGEDLAALAQAVAAGEIRPTLARSYTFAEATQAVDAVRSAAFAGKVVLTP